MRKGLTTEQAIVIVLFFAIVMIIGFGMFNKVYGASKSSFTDSQCKASALLTRAADFSPTCTVEPKNPIPLKCERNFVAVSDDVVVNGKDVTAERKGLCPDGTKECLGEEALAKEMERCWSLFMDGENPVFQQLEIDEFFSLTPDTNKRACFVCGEVTLEKGAPKFDAYIRSKNTKKNISYYEYFTNPKAYCDPELKAPSCWEGMADPAKTGNNFDQIEQKSLPAGTYAVVFMRRGMGKCEEEKTGDKDTFYQSRGVMTNTVQAVPAANISRHCSMVIV